MGIRSRGKLDLKLMTQIFDIFVLGNETGRPKKYLLKKIPDILFSILCFFNWPVCYK